MNIKFEIKSKTDVKNLYVRMYQGKFDVSAPIGLLVLESDWDAENNSFYLANPLNLKLQELKVSILRAYNQSFSQGEIITSIWLKQVVKEEFNRPINEIALVNDSKDIYLTDFGDWWNDNKADLWKVGPKKLLSSVQKSQYKKIISQLKEFEKSVGFKLVMKDITLDNLYEVVNYFEENDYNSSTISRNIDRIRFFMNRASEEGLKVSNVRSQRVYIDKDSEEIEKPYLTNSEINKIINTDFGFDPELNIAKQNYTILLFTGLRGSDGLKKLDISNIDNGFIKIKTSKTGQTVVLPVHDEIKKVIKQNFGNLPPKMNLTDFNKAIKRIAQVCEIDQMIEGKLFDSKKKRKVKGIYKKYELLSSHSCRRGFVTLHKDVISIDAMCSLLGWSSSAMFKIYNQTTKEEYAKELQKSWSTDKLISLYDKNSKLSHANNLLNYWDGK